LLDKTRCGNEDVEIVVYKLASSEYSVLWFGKLNFGLTPLS
jgi:hypothetical protein